MTPSTHRAMSTLTLLALAAFFATAGVARAEDSLTFTKGASPRVGEGIRSVSVESKKGLAKTTATIPGQPERKMEQPVRDSSRSDVSIRYLAVDKDGDVQRCRVTIHTDSKATIQRDGTDKTESSPVAGKTFTIHRKGDGVEILDDAGKVLTGDARARVLKLSPVDGSSGKSKNTTEDNPEIALLQRAPMKVGETRSLNAKEQEMARAQAGGPEGTKVTESMTLERIEDGPGGVGKVGVFKLEMSMTGPIEEGATARIVMTGSCRVLAEGTVLLSHKTSGVMTIKLDRTHPNGVIQKTLVRTDVSRIETNTVLAPETEAKAGESKERGKDSDKDSGKDAKPSSGQAEDEDPEGD